VNVRMVGTLGFYSCEVLGCNAVLLSEWLVTFQKEPGAFVRTEKNIQNTLRGAVI
jgi:hypothetical protein